MAELKESWLYKEVLKERRETQERLNDPDGMTVAERKAHTMKMAQAKAEQQRLDSIREKEQNERAQMIAEDKWSHALRNQEKRIERERSDRFAAHAESKRLEWEHSKITHEDDRSRALNFAWREAELKRLHREALETAAFSDFLPACKDDENAPVLWKPKPWMLKPKGNPSSHPFQLSYPQAVLDYP